MGGTIVDSILLFTIVLVMATCSGYFSERVGIANLSINGQMIFGAFVFCIFSELIFPDLGPNSFFLVMIIGTLFGLVGSTLFGFLTIKIKANQIIAGTAVNLLMLGLATFLTSPLAPIVSNGLHSKLMPNYYSLVELGNSSGFYLSTLLLFIFTAIIIIGLYLLIKFTPFGLRLRAIGNNPNAVDAQGINVEKYQWIAISIGGLLAGFAGSVFVFSSNNSPFNGDVSGIGFLAIAILIAGSWKVPLIVLVSFLFATLSKVFENLKNVIPSDVAKMIPYIVTLIAMVAFSKWNFAPKNLGIPFDKTKR